MDGKNDLLTKSEVKGRGWTEGLIAKFLPYPDETKTNPHYKSGPRMKLYRLARVAEAEESPAFQEATAALAKRREGAAKAVATKRAKLVSYLNSVRIRVPELSKEKLINRACWNYNERQEQRDFLAFIDGDNCASEDSDPEFLERISVNYLRHRMTGYEHHLAKIAGKVGTRDAYLEIKKKVLDAIAEAYPWLGAECSRQEKWTREMREQAELEGFRR